MTPFSIERAADAADAVWRFANAEQGAHYIAGGTTMVDLMKLDALRPELLVELLGLRAEHGAIIAAAEHASIGAFATMADVAAHPAIRAGWPAVEIGRASCRERV